MNQLSQAMRARFANLLGRHLPGRTKRLIFLASFTARLKDSTDLSQETLLRLNKLMVLANSDSAIKLPVQLSRAIWRGKSHSEICERDVLGCNLTQDCIRRVAARVTQQVPQWLRYADEHDIQQDVAKLLGNRAMVLGA